MNPTTEQNTINLGVADTAPSQHERDLALAKDLAQQLASIAHQLYEAGADAGTIGEVNRAARAAQDVTGSLWVARDAQQKLYGGK